MRGYDAMTELQHNIQRLLDERGWSKQHLADEIGMQRSQLSRLITSDQAPSPTIKTLERIAAAFNVEPWDLLIPRPKSSHRNVLQKSS